MGNLCIFTSLEPPFMKTFNYLLLFLLIATAGCKTNSGEPENSFGWLKGRWQAKDNTFTIREEWAMEGDTMLAGFDKGFSNEGQLIMEEKMGICKREGEVYYLLTLNRVLVAFKLDTEKDAEPGKFIFNNPNTGFPEMIVLKKISDDSFIAAIEGGKGETHIRRELTFTRLK